MDHVPWEDSPGRGLLAVGLFPLIGGILLLKKTMKPRLLLRQPNYDQTGNENACQHRAGLSELEICSYESHE
jgi:hypothetical protein